MSSIVESYKVIQREGEVEPPVDPGAELVTAAVAELEQSLGERCKRHGINENSLVIQTGKEDTPGIVVKVEGYATQEGVTTAAQQEDATKISDDLPAKRVKEIKEVIEKHPKAKELKPLIANNYSPGNNIGHDRQIQRIVNRHKRMLNFNPLNKKLLNPKWLLRHGSIGLTVAGSLALGGFLAKNIYDIAKR